MTLSNEVLVAALTALGVIAGGLITWARMRGKDAASATHDVAMAKREGHEGEASVAGVILSWAQRMEAQVKTLEGKVKALEDELGAVKREAAKLRRHNELLTSQVIDLGGVPVPMPGEDE